MGEDVIEKVEKSLLYKDRSVGYTKTVCWNDCCLEVICLDVYEETGRVLERGIKVLKFYFSMSSAEGGPRAWHSTMLVAFCFPRGAAIFLPARQ